MQIGEDSSVRINPDGVGLIPPHDGSNKVILAPWTLPFAGLDPAGQPANAQDQLAGLEQPIHHNHDHLPRGR